MQKTLGGDRLGSGKKMTTELTNYDRSTHNLSYIMRTTMSSGTLVPFMNKLALPGDTWDIELDTDFKTHPTIGPLFGSYKIQLDVFECPIRLYNARLHNNELGIGMNMAQIKLPQYRLIATPTLPAVGQDINTSQINPSCILAYLGVRGIGRNNTLDPQTRDFNAIPLLGYWDIYKNYYANKQEEIGAVIHTNPPIIELTVTAVKVGVTTIPQLPAISPIALSGYFSFFIEFAGAQPHPSTIMIQTTSGTYSIETLTDGFVFLSAPGVLQGQYAFGRWGTLIAEGWRYILDNEINQTAPKIETFPLASIDQMRKNILAAVNVAGPFILNAQVLAPYQYVLGQNPDGYNFALGNQEGLALKTYQSDLFNNWLKTSWIDGPGGIGEITAVSTAGDSFQIDTLILAKKVYNLLNRIAVSGGSYDDYIDAVWQSNPWTRTEIPIYHGGLIKELIFQEVVSNSASGTGEQGEQPLGTLAGKGVMAKKHKGGKIRIKVSEPGYIIGIVSLTPRIDYSQGNDWDTQLKTIDDLHKPALDQIGFQELITEQMAFWTTQWNPATDTWDTLSAGKQPSWQQYRTDYNRCYGNFAIINNEMFMTLNRRYEHAPELQNIKDLTTYIDPAKYNQIFAQTSLDSQNFWCQIAVDAQVRRLMSERVMPSL